ncbi:transporter [Paraburkholderia phymatum]|uniref:Transporter n=1 Tax=Paraburkholderia phymatum TaxID=148447 RepID=A0ACC6TYY0_9BURK
MSISNPVTKLILGLSLGITSWTASADEGGVGFWLPGSFGSFAATPSDPGWTLGATYYHSSASLGADEASNRGGRVTVGVDARADLLFLAPTYTFASPVAGGQAAISLLAAPGRERASVQATLSGPRGFAISGNEKDSVTGFSDIFAQGTLRWNQGVHNYMVYAMSALPVGSYNTNRLVNLGLNHWAIDAGGGYTYLDPKAGHEFSAVFGFTYNFENHDTNYKNGVDSHLDWAASQFLSEKVHVGLVGYFFQQLTGDSGAGATLGGYKSRVAAIGPQLGYFFKVDERKWYANAKGYYEFSAQNRAAGWNIWLTLAIPLGSGK